MHHYIRVIALSWTYSIPWCSVLEAFRQVRLDITERQQPHKPPEVPQDSDFWGPDRVIDAALAQRLVHDQEAGTLDLIALDGDHRHVLAVETGEGSLLPASSSSDVLSRCRLRPFEVTTGGTSFYVWASSPADAADRVKERIYQSRHERGSTRHGREISYSFLKHLREGTLDILVIDPGTKNLLYGERTERLQDVLNQDNGSVGCVVLDRRLSHMLGWNVSANGLELQLRALDPETRILIREEPVTRRLAQRMQRVLSPNQLYSTPVPKEVMTS